MLCRINFGQSARGSLRQSWSWSLGTVVFAEGNSSAKLPPPHFLSTSSLQLVRVAVANLPSTSVQAMPLLLAISRLVPVTSEPSLGGRGDKMLPHYYYSCSRRCDPPRRRGGDRHICQREGSFNISCPRPNRHFMGFTAGKCTFFFTWATVTFPTPEPVRPTLQGFPTSLAAPFLSSLVALYYFLTSISIGSAMCSGGGGGGHE